MLELIINVYLACQVTCGTVDPKALQSAEAYVEQLAQSLDVQDEKLYIRQGLSPSRLKDIGFSLRAQGKIKAGELFVVFTPETVKYDELMGIQVEETYGGFYVKNHSTSDTQVLVALCASAKKPYDLSLCAFEPVKGPGIANASSFDKLYKISIDILQKLGI